MKKTCLLILLLFAGLSVQAQSVSVYRHGKSALNYNATSVDSIVFDTKTFPETPDAIGSGVREINAHWCSLGTSITWYNNNVSASGGRFTEGYQTRVLKRLKFATFTNKGVNGGCLSSAIGAVIKADYYTIEHGINDWGHSVKVGTMDDYKNNTQNGTFAADFRRLIDAIYKANPSAKIVLCTPRKAYGFGTYLPAHWYDAYNGIYLKDYADLIKEIGEYEGLPVADFFGECGGQSSLAKLSIDVALHPNDPGYQMMANVLVQALEKIIVE